jgi:hypothetical protein
MGCPLSLMPSLFAEGMYIFALVFAGISTSSPNCLPCFFQRELTLP